MKKFLTLIGFLFVIGGVQAWVEPTLAPPNGNVTAPLRLDSNGRLGIGVSSPGKKVEVVGEIVPRSSATSGTLAGSLVADAFGLNLWVNSAYDPSNPNSGWSRALTAVSGPRIGIGTTAPNEPLEVANSTNGGRFIVSDNGGASRRTLLLVSPTAANPSSRIESYNYGASTGLPLYINSSGAGNVSIGNIATTYRLNVAGDVNIPTGSCYRVNGTCISSGTVDGTGTTNYLSKFTAASTLGNSVIYDNGTNVGIGTTNPGGKLEVVGNSTFSGDINASSVLLVSNTNSGGNGLYSTAGLYGVMGYSTGGAGVGVYGSGLTGISGQGAGGASGKGVIGAAQDGRGVEGVSTYGYGVYCNAGGTGFCGGTRAWTNTSDLRLKKNIETITDGIGKVMKLRGVTYNWKTDVNNERSNVGFIAQEVRDVVPEVISQNSDGYYTINESSITAVLVEAIKDLKKENDDLRARLEKLEAKVK